MQFDCANNDKKAFVDADPFNRHAQLPSEAENRNADKFADKFAHGAAVHKLTLASSIAGRPLRIHETVNRTGRSCSAVKTSCRA